MKGVSRLSKIIGHHHISMYTKNITRNKAFYLDVLGLDLIKETVNQDNETMPHIFYGNASGDPGTLLTFFEIPLAGTVYKGTNMIARIGLLVQDRNMLDLFEVKLEKHGISTQRGIYLHQDALYFDDPETLSFVMIANEGYKLPAHWHITNEETSTTAETILGMGPIEIHVEDIASTAHYLTEHLGYRKREGFEETVYTLNEKGFYSDIVLIQQDGPQVRPGKGYVHHHAFAIKKADMPTILDIHDHLPHQHSGVINRQWFESLYYRQNFITYEFATVEPGF
ncbi:ring-cleaving dioxygenase [Staphylococcus agnetis]|nr:ring-cleaving dioxygenase [Staphylococcus agnetis]